MLADVVMSVPAVRHALVLGGGGAAGAYQVGVLKKLMHDDGVDHEVVIGVSVGALNGAKIACSPLGDSRNAWKSLERVWSRVSRSSVYRAWPFGRVESLFRGSLYDSRPLRETLERELDAVAVASSGKKLRIGATSLTTGRERFVTERDDEFISWVLASASYPVMMPPVELDGELWVDGAIRVAVPVCQALLLGARHVDVVLCSQQWSSVAERFDARTLPAVARRCVEILFDKLAVDDLRAYGVDNEFAVIASSYGAVTINVMRPSRRLCTDIMKFDEREIAMAMRLGYEDALADKWVRVV